MSFNDFFFGTPPQTNVQFAPGFRAPGYGFARDLGNYLRTLIGTPAPSYPGQIDPGMSPTMQMLGRMTQGYSNSPAPQIMGQVAGALGRHMNPGLQSPLEQLGRQISNPFQPNPNGGGGPSPGGRPGVMPGSDPSASLPGVGGGAGAYGVGGGAGGGSPQGADGGGPTVDFQTLDFPQEPLPTDARPMFQGIGGGLGGPPPSGPIYAGGPAPAGLPRGVHVPPSFGPPPLYPSDPLSPRDPRFQRGGGLEGDKRKKKQFPFVKRAGGPTGPSATPPTGAQEDPRLAEIRQRIGARPRPLPGGRR